MKNALAVMAISLCLGCSHVVPNYSESVENVERLKRAGPSAGITVGEFRGAADVQKMETRANSFESPYRASFSEYIREALRAELARAGMLQSAGAITIEGVLEKNRLDIAGSDVGTLELEVLFRVRRGAHTAYERRKAAKLEWQSSFVGAIAIPLARDQYPAAVRRLLGELFADADFQRALRGR